MNSYQVYDSYNKLIFHYVGNYKVKPIKIDLYPKHSCQFLSISIERDFRKHEISHIC